ncbi:MAG: hypothetical protein ABJG47_14160 [Ekhidna sp.]
MSHNHLYSGIALVIDDALDSENQENDGISSIVDNLENSGIPLLKRREIPKQNEIDNYRALNFIILDWRLKPLNWPLGMELSEEIESQIIGNNINFLKEIRSKVFVPVFIFTTDAIEDVTEHLQKAKLYESEESKNFILIRSKNKLQKAEDLNKAIEDWIVNNPSVYTMKEWEHSFYQAKNSTFWHLFDRSAIWPKVLWNSYEDDLVDPVFNFNETLFRQIMSRSKIDSLQKKFIQGADNLVLDKEEIKEVLKGLMYLDESYLNKDEFRPGDVFKGSKSGKYLLNIRPECDTVTGRTDGYLYLIKGSKMTPNQAERHFGDNYSKDLGIREKHDESILFGIDGSDFVVFKFNEVKIEEANSLKDKRKCRILHPYINNIQQKFSSYSSRVGLPRFPHDLMVEIVPTTKEDQEDKNE